MGRTEDHGNFAHLAELDAPLARLGGLAERFFIEDANTSVIKSRQFAERMAREVAERLGLDLDPAADLVAVLGALRSDGSVTKAVLDVFHRIRKAGNGAVHGHDGERREAFEALKLSHRLGVWFRATVTRTPDLRIAFVPPRARPDETAELRALIAEQEARLAEVETEAERLRRQAQESLEARTEAEQRATLAEEERQLVEELAFEAERRAAAGAPAAEDRMAFVQAAQASGRSLDLDESDTRVLIDEQLRAAGWAADTSSLRHGLGTRPE